MSCSRSPARPAAAAGGGNDPINVLDGGGGGGNGGDAVDGGGGGGQGGNGGVGGLAGGGGDPDMGGGGDGGVDCGDDGPDVSAALSEDRPYHRGEAAEITFTVDREAEMSFEADHGGRFTPRADRVFWAAGGGEPGDVDWPWWTGPVEVTVRATDGNGCTATAIVAVTLYGDVIVGDLSRSYLFALGSDGRRLGRFRQVTERGIEDAILLPDRGYAVILGEDGDEPAFIRRLDEQGDMVLDFDAVDSGDNPLWAHDEPAHLLYDPIRELLWVDNGLDSYVHRFRLDGTWVDRVLVPGHNNFNDETIGFAQLGDGRVLVAHDGGDEVYAIGPDDVPVIFAEVEQDVTTLASDHEGGVVVVQGDRNSVVWMAFLANGRECVRQEFYQSPDADHLVTFRDGYLYTHNSGGHVRYLDRQLRPVDEEDAPFRQMTDFDDFRSVQGPMWLHAP